MSIYIFLCHLLPTTILFFCGEDSQRIPEHNDVELEKKFFFIGSIFALSLVHACGAQS